MSSEQPAPVGEQTPPGDTGGILSNSAVMAAGTLLSRFSGYFRTILLAAALGNAIHADVFNIANTIPNMLYILLAGGAINAVLVPQLVRAAAADRDGGEAYTNRVVTLTGLFLGTVTVALVVAAPWVMQLFLDPGMPAAARDSAVDFARLCLPQVFFYGMFVLLGQILNARGRFGPMMWAPIVNNLIAIATLAAYLLVFGADEPLAPGYDVPRELLLGLGSTFGIVAQLLVLLPYLRAAGVRLRPRFDFRDAGLGHTLRLGVWTLGFVILNQIAYTVVVRLASSGTAGGDPSGTGYTVYSQTFLIMMVPHAVITVSLATAILPRLSRFADAGQIEEFRATLAGTLRTALVLVVMFAALLPILARLLAQLLWGYGAAAETVENYVPTLALWGPALVLFTAHYLILRGFYAREQTRTVFFIQAAVAVTNIGAALLLVHLVAAPRTAPALVVAYTLAYAVGSLLSYQVLRRRLGGLETRRLAWFAVRLLVAVAGATAAAYAVRTLWPDYELGPDAIPTMVAHGAVIGVVALVVLVILAVLLRLREVTEVTDLVTRRLLPRRG